MTNGQETGDDGFALTSWLAGELTAFAEPLIAAGQSPAAASALLANIGWQSDVLPDLITVIQQGATAIDDAVTALEGFLDGSDGSDGSGGGAVSALSELQSLLTAAQAVGAAVSALSQAASAGSTVAGLEQLGEDLLAWLTDRYLSTAHPLAYGIGVLLTLVTPQANAPQQPPVTSASGQVLRAAYQLPSLNLDKIGALLRDPQTFLRGVYLTAGSLVTPTAVTAFADALFPVIADALNGFGIGASYGLDPYFDELGIDAATTALLQHGLTFWLLDSSTADAVALGATLALLGPDASTNNQVAAVVAPFFPPDFSPGFLGGWDLTLGISGGAPLTIVGWSPYPADSASWPGLDFTLTLTLGQWTGASGIASAGSAGGGPGTNAGNSAGSPSGPGAQLSLGLAVGASTVIPQIGFTAQGTASVDPSDFDDGFLAEVLPDGGISVPVSLQVAGSSQGLTLRASVSQGGAIVLATFPAADLGPLTIDDGQFAVTPQATSLTAAATFSASLSFGPLTATVEGLGIGLVLAWPSGGGNAGPFSLTPGIVWPAGAGLVIDAGPATGGGFAFFDQPHGQYSGVLQLALESLSLTAIGLIQTKNADGSPLPGGFSLLVIISVEFVPFIELGFGFSLNGVGGFLGLDRTMNEDALRAAVHSGSLGDLMFPADPVGHAPQLIQELAGLFPAAPGRFLIGPMVQIQWGSPLTILTADLGVIIELPAPIRIAILGVLQLGLPQADEDAIILLNLDVLGIVDFGLGTLSLDASLYGSRIAEFPVSGDMALRMGWKAERDFLISFGGYNPGQQVPPGFPSLDRLAICLSSSDTLSLTMQAYFAATSNTLQFGASAHLLVQIGGVGVDGMVSFDALIHKNPFGLQVNFAAAVTVRFDGQQLLAVSLAGQLSGPAPWQISGQASISLLFISASVSFQFPLGSAAAAALLGPVGVIGLLATDVGLTVNWSALPPSGNQVVTLSPTPTSGTAMRAHPLGSVTFRQHTVPLGLAMDKFGGADISGPSKLALTSISYGNITLDPAAITPVQDAFAPGQFLALSDSDALSLPAFSNYQTGVTFTPAAPDLDSLAAGDAVALGYALGLIDSQGQLPASQPVPLDAPTATRLVPSSPAARAPTRTTGASRYQGTTGTIAVNPRPPAGREAP